MDPMHLHQGLAEVLTAGVVLWLVSKIRFRTPSHGGRRVARYSGTHLWCGWVGVLFFGGCLVAMSFSDHPSGHSRWARTVFGGFAMLGAIMIAMNHRCALIYGDDDICYHPFWGKAITFTWRDVAKVSYNPNAEWWRLRLPDGRNVRVGVMMDGGVEFMQALAMRGKVSISPIGLRNGAQVYFYSAPSEPSMRSSSPNDHA